MSFCQHRRRHELAEILQLEGSIVETLMHPEMRSLTKQNSPLRNARNITYDTRPGKTLTDNICNVGL